MTLHESDRPAALLARLDAIGRALDASGHGMALLGLGSVGLELERLDAYSDLDFFAIVEAGHKGRTRISISLPSSRPGTRVATSTTWIG